ncbi:MAG: hypothetical protein D3924_03805 [Candidatus Electrothrix sp. AR4]|nr:hypothetical protein [Candidatus Electrothrix sp. AR4]
MRKKMFGPFALLVVLFPLTGLIFIFFGVKKALQGKRLLQYGILTKGKLVSKDRTHTTINEQRMYKFTFSFKDISGRKFEILEKTHKIHLLQDDTEESLLYLKDNPDDA